MKKNDFKMELEKRSNILLKAHRTIEAFAQQYGKKVCYSTYHDWPSISVSFKNMSPNGEYYIIKEICLMLKQWDEPIKYRLVIFLYRWYGIKEILAIIPVLNKFIKIEHSRFEEELVEFNDPIDTKTLQSMLLKAKTTIDNYKEIPTGSKGRVTLGHSTRNKK